MKGSDKLIHIYIDSSNQYFILIDDVIYDSEKNMLIYYPPGKNDTCFDIDDGVEIIGNNSFIKNNIQTLVVPNSVKTIEEAAFYAMKYVKSIRIPSIVTSIERNTLAFSEMLEEVIILSNEIIIGDKAFYGCSRLKRVLFLGNTIETGDDTFGKCDALKDVKVLDTYLGNQRLY